MKAVALGDFEQRPVVAFATSTSIHVWDLVDAERVRAPLITGVSAIAIGQLSSRMVLASGFDDEVRVWDLMTGERLNEIRTGHREVEAVAVGRLGNVPVLVSAGDQTVRVWNLTTGALVFEPLHAVPAAAGLDREYCRLRYAQPST